MIGGLSHLRSHGGLVPALPSSILEPLWVHAHPPRLPPAGLHRLRIPDRLVFDKLVQVLVFGCGYRRIADGRPSLRRKPHAGDRLPVARVARDGQACWLGGALATPTFPCCCAAALATGTQGSLPRWADPTPARWPSIA